MSEVVSKAAQVKATKLGSPEAYARRFMAQMRCHLKQFRRENNGRVPPVFNGDQVDLSALIELVRTMSSYSSREATLAILKELAEALMFGRLNDYNGDIKFYLEHPGSDGSQIKPGGVLVVTYKN